MNLIFKMGTVGRKSAMAEFSLILVVVIMGFGQQSSVLVHGNDLFGLGNIGQMTNSLNPSGLLNSLSGGLSSLTKPFASGAGPMSGGIVPAGSIDGLTSGLAAAVGMKGLTNPALEAASLAKSSSASLGFGLGVSPAAAAPVGATSASLHDPLTVSRTIHPQVGTVIDPLHRGIMTGVGAASVDAEILKTEPAAATVGFGLPAAIGSGFRPSVGLAALNPLREIADPPVLASPLSAAAQAPVIGGIAPNPMLGRPALAADAFNNAQAEAAIAGTDMAAHGANNARSASLASNAYRQAKLATARDRVNIAGTIQNSARISDAAIATHDTATKAEDSLLGSELAVDSAATVLDSDAAYIPPVTNSLLRSLPYGRIGLRNIVPKPLTYPSVILPDVWLNGIPVNYLNVPYRMPPYGIAGTGIHYPISIQPLGSGLVMNGQPFSSNNGFPLNNLVMDPQLAHFLNMNGVPGSSIFPVLANGQLEAQDEINTANRVAMQQQAGAGMRSTYNGFGMMNTVPMLTGSVTDLNLAPTTTIGTTYPIGSALVIEPRDSYFQDYIDNASSRQNFDERQQ